jgi:hypothetical protein
MKDSFSLNIASSRIGFAWIRILVLILCALCVLRGESLAQEFKQVHPGVEYAQVTHKIGADPVKINLLRLDLKKVRLDVHHALDKATGLETTSSIANRKSAVAAINAGFFRLDKSQFAGDTAGFLMIDGEIWSESVNDRIAIMIENGPNDSKVWFAHINLNYHVTILKKKLSNARNYFISGVNRERKPNEVILYTPRFGSSTLTDADGVEIVIEENGRNRIVKGSGNTTIPAKGVVLSGSGDKIDELLRLISPKTHVAIGSGVSVVDVPGKPQQAVIFAFSKIEDVTSGVPQLIKDGKIDITWEQEKASKAFVETRHPRTAVAKLKDGKFLMVTVDGRQPGVSVGMSLQELAEYLLSLGAMDAMNLDGGGSTTMYLDGKVVNTPSDKEGERKIGDAIVVTLRK